MKLLVTISAVLVLLLLFSCNCMTTSDKNQVYAAWEEGLTLVFENITLSNSNSCTKKRQVTRVAKVSEAPTSHIVV